MRRDVLDLREFYAGALGAAAREMVSRKVAEAYLDFLYTPAAQKIIARNFYRPSKPESADAADLARFPRIRLVTVDQAFGGWAKAQAEHFAEGGTFDQIYNPGGKPATR